MLVVAAFRERRAGSRWAGVENRAYAKMLVIPVGAAAIGAVIGSSIAVAMNDNPHIFLIVRNISWAILVAGALVRLVKKDLGLLVCTGIGVVVAVVSFFFAQGLT